MRRIPGRLMVLCAMLAGVLAVGATAAQASGTGAKFKSDTSASVVVGGPGNGALSIFIDESGVGQLTVNYTLDWTATADYGCINGGGNHPQATNKATTSAGAATSFSESPINGRVMATFVVPGTPPPVSPSTFSCPGGQTLVLADVSYSATLTDTTNNSSIMLSASHTFFTFKM
jgi:hypothetical protein